MLKSLRTYILRQADEIANDTALRIYGAFLAFGHVITFLYWRAYGYTYTLSNLDKPVCWPFFEDCFAARVFSQAQVNGILWCFGILAVAGVVLFLDKRRVKAAYFFQVGMLIFKLALFAWDFRMRMNQHYMLHFALITYLFIPNKRANLQYLLVFFYFGAAFLKLNAEWMSGAVFNVNHKPMLIPESLLPAACVYAVFLELVIVWGMLSRNQWIYWSTFAQLMLFHLLSWPVVGFYYPILMTALLMIFPLTYFYAKQEREASYLQALFRLKQARSTYLLTAFFFVCQLVPVLFPGDERITTEGRLFSLHMYDARPVCEGAFTLKFKDGTRSDIVLPNIYKPRIKCDPLVYFSRAKFNCWKNRDNPAFDDLDYVLNARLSTGKDLRPLVKIRDFCGKNLHYNLFWGNDWIMK